LKTTLSPSTSLKWVGFSFDSMLLTATLYLLFLLLLSLFFYSFSFSFTFSSPNSQPSSLREKGPSLR
jgi:preprotein translocase subunit SecY